MVVIYVFVALLLGAAGALLFGMWLYSHEPGSRRHRLGRDIYSYAGGVLVVMVVWYLLLGGLALVYHLMRN